MASYSKIASEDWLLLFQTNWKQATHFEIYNQDDEEVLWLLADPGLDPFEAVDIRELSILLYRPRQELPNHRFTCSIVEDKLLFKGKLDDRNVTLEFRVSSNDPSILRSSFDYDRIWFNIKNPRQDIFFKPFKYNDDRVKPGSRVLYDGKIWRFVRWAGGKDQVHLEHIEDGKVVARRNPTVGKCLLAQKDLSRRRAGHIEISRDLKVSSSLDNATDLLNELASLNISKETTHRRLSPD